MKTYAVRRSTHSAGFEPARGTPTDFKSQAIVVYYETCDERLGDKVERSTPLAYTVAWGTGTPKDQDKINRRQVCECDG